MSDYAADIGLMHMLADSADSLSMTQFKSSQLERYSPSQSQPADHITTTIEKALRATLLRARPRDNIIGREFGTTSAFSGSGHRQWIIDPINAIDNYLRGVPIWGTLIALLDAGQPVGGLISAPALNRRWWAALGTGAFVGRNLSAATALSVSRISRLADASLSYSSLPDWAIHDQLDGFFELSRLVSRSRAYGDFYSYMLVAEGATDIAAEPISQLWDIAAASIIVKESGGKFTDLSGRNNLDSGHVLATNGLLHSFALEYVGL